ncbi:serine/threonine protein kinase [Nonomuraea maritima]|uniref:non-specific serine/threonine protein kinase n=1 Tax=Nonomuraea maritima TaxID=683260 RepID=A0A1G9PUC9_9ACTN|nr:serine/threonine-protein kinase [Nonomuraea maritima]SDM01725.1 serine/threonine protein kinase [Nonomuraea maritima]
MSDATPSLVADRYRLDERIGSGPMGDVWRGYDTRADWVVAVKVLRARAAGAATREVLRQHAQTVARVIHPNVAMVLDVGDNEGAPFLVMEFLTGLSLGEELAARGPLRIVEVCDLIGQAAAGLDAAHRAGVVHGRVDPDSFRMAASGVLKVVGFGMDERETASGSSRYVAPERGVGEAAQAPGDIYALGCVAYELLCGRPPSEGAPQGPPVPPSAIRPEVSAELDRLVLAMLAEDPARRPASGEAIRRALAAIARPRPAAPVTGASLRDPGFAAPPGVPGHGAPGPQQFGPGPQPRAGDTAVMQAVDLGPEPGQRPNRKLALQLGAAVLAIVLVTVVMVMVAGSREEQPLAVPTTVPTTVPATAPTVAELETLPTPEPQPSQSLVNSYGPGGEPTALRETAPPKGRIGESVPPGGWNEWTRAFDDSLMAQQRMGGIDPRVAGKARDKLSKAARRVRDGRPEASLHEITDVYRDLERAQREGRMDPTGPASDFMRDWSLPGR